MKQNKPAATSKIWHVPQFRNLELLRAQHLTHTFPLHTHERYAIGVIEQGALGFYYRGQNVVAAPGHINLCVPGEPHTGHPATNQGWTYRMFYFDVHTLQKIASEVAERPRDIPFFQPGVIVDHTIAYQLHQLHVQLEGANVPQLEQETALLEVLAQFIRRHAYLRQVRIQRAKALLVAGHAIADAALATGFTDQSHLTRWFKRLWGFTPGQYRNNVQDKSIYTR